MIGSLMSWDGDSGTESGILVQARHYKRGKNSKWVELKFEGPSGASSIVRVRPNVVFTIERAVTK